MSNNAHELSNRLLNALDTNYNVVDMQTVNDIITILEKINITKELLETTRLGKHVNELRRKTTDQTLARRAKVLVKRWRDMVIPTGASPAHTGSNRSSAERQVRIGRLGGTPLTSPALPSHVLSPAVSSPRTTSRPAWGGYESDSQDVILVDDDPPVVVVEEPSLPTPIACNLNTTVKPLSPVTITDEKKIKRDKKLKKRKGHSRAGTEAAEWGARNGTRRNGCAPADAYEALVNRIPPAGGKKVKTTKELLREIQSRGTKPVPLSPHSPHSPHSPDVMLIESEPSPPSAEVPSEPSHTHNGSQSPSGAVAVEYPALEDAREYAECSCGDIEDPECGAALTVALRPAHVHGLHHAYLPGVNGTRAPIYPHQFAVRKLTDPEAPDLFTSVVPLYKYSDYADDFCSKNMSKVPLCTHLPWTEWAPSPPSPPRPKTPPTPRPYPIVIQIKEEKEVTDCDSDEDSEPKEDFGMDVEESNERLKSEDSKFEIQETVNYDDRVTPELDLEDTKLEIKDAEDEKGLKTDSNSNLRDSKLVEGTVDDEERLTPELERLRPEVSETEDCERMVTEDSKADLVSDEENSVKVPVEFASDIVEHRTVERTKDDGRTIYEFCKSVRDSIPYNYNQVDATPVVNFDSDDAVLNEAFSSVGSSTERDDLGRPLRPSNFAEWHECCRLGELIALPYVVID